MATRFAHRAKLLAMDLTITAMQHTRSSDLLSSIFRRVYRLTSDGHFLLWAASLITFGIAGFLIGYLTYFLVPK
jgi:hypothetical protein